MASTPAARVCGPGPPRFRLLSAPTPPPAEPPPPASSPALSWLPSLRSDYPRLPSAPKRFFSSAPPSARQLSVDFCLQEKLRGRSGPGHLLRPPLRLRPPLWLPPSAAPHPPALPAARVSTVISRAPAPIRARRPACHWPRRIFRRPAGWSGGPRLPLPRARAELSPAARPLRVRPPPSPRSSPGAPEENPEQQGGRAGAGAGYRALRGAQAPRSRALHLTRAH